MWARQLEESLFEICCIPFVVYDMALGDIVEASPSDHYTVLRTTRHSGRYTFRAYFGDTDHPAQAIYEQLTEAGALLEWSSPSLLAIDSADAAHAIFIAEFLGERASHGQLVYEKGFSEPLT
ncbi:protein of unknown function [Jiangella sp. DSM 45060]|nr:protein of unknown function [Jiangella sp. DSM 45060]